MKIPTTLLGKEFQSGDGTVRWIDIPIGGTLNHLEYNVDRILESVMETFIQQKLQEGLRSLFD
jgi:hypothetical protein